MPDQPISALTALAASAVADEDLLPVVDASSNDVKKLSLAVVRWSLGLARNLADAQAATFPSALAFATLLEEGVRYERVVSEPAHSDKFQSADGVWWQRVSTPVTKYLTWTALTAAPTDLPSAEAVLVLADRATWDPLAKGSGGPYFAVTYDAGVSWHAPDAQFTLP